MNVLFKILATSVLVAVISGCVITPPQESQSRPLSFPTHFPFFHRTMVVTIVHTCTEKGEVHWIDDYGNQRVTKVIGATPQNIYPHPTQGDRNVRVIFESLNSSGEVVGTFSERFPVTDYSDRAQTWKIGDSSSGGWDRRSYCRGR